MVRVGPPVGHGLIRPVELEDGVDDEADEPDPNMRSTDTMIAPSEEGLSVAMGGTDDLLRADAMVGHAVAGGLAARTRPRSSVSTK